MTTQRINQPNLRRVWFVVCGSGSAKTSSSTQRVEEGEWNKKLPILSFRNATVNVTVWIGSNSKVSVPAVVLVVNPQVNFVLPKIKLVAGRKTASGSSSPPSTISLSVTMTDQSKLDMYVDESGQATGSHKFYVVAILLNRQFHESLTAALQQIERTSGKNLRKWVHTPTLRRKAFLDGLSLIWPIIRPVYFGKFNTDKEYLAHTAHVIMEALARKIIPRNGQVTIIIDGLNQVEREVVQRAFRKARLAFKRKIRGGRDEHSPFIRLADALVGFIRHFDCNRPYASELWKTLNQYFEEIR